MILKLSEVEIETKDTEQSHTNENRTSKCEVLQMIYFCFAKKGQCTFRFFSNKSKMNHQYQTFPSTFTK